MKKLLFVIVVGTQILFLAGMSVSYYLIDDVGQTIKLKTEPIDPQDIFYGDYITLWYEVERIPAELLVDSNKSELKRNQKVYVLVERNETGIYQATAASVNRIKAGDNQAVLTGRYSYYDDYDKVHYMEYGISRYFIEDNTGEKYEQQGSLVVTVAVAPWGQKRIMQVN